MDENNVLKDSMDSDFASIDFDAISMTPLAGEKSVEKEKDEKVDIDPEFAIYLIDLFITRVISVGAKFAGYEIKPNDLALTKTEIARLKPHAKKALSKFIGWLEEKFPDYFMFITVLLITYSSKAVLYAKKVDPKKPQKPPAEQQKVSQSRRTKTATKRITKTSKIK